MSTRRQWCRARTFQDIIPRDFKSRWIMQAIYRRHPNGFRAPYPGFTACSASAGSQVQTRYFKMLNLTHKLRNCSWFQAQQNIFESLAAFTSVLPLLTFSFRTNRTLANLSGKANVHTLQLLQGRRYLCARRRQMEGKTRICEFEGVEHCGWFAQRLRRKNCATRRRWAEHVNFDSENTVTTEVMHTLTIDSKPLQTSHRDLSPKTKLPITTHKHNRRDRCDRRERQTHMHTKNTKTERVLLAVPYLANESSLRCVRCNHQRPQCVNDLVSLRRILEPNEKKCSSIH